MNNEAISKETYLKCMIFTVKKYLRQLNRDRINAYKYACSELYIEIRKELIPKIRYTRLILDTLQSQLIQ